MKHSDKWILLCIVIGAGVIFVVAILMAKLFAQEDVSLAEARNSTETSVESEESVPSDTEESDSAVTSEEIPPKDLKITGAEELDEGLVVKAPMEMEWEEAVELLETCGKKDERYRQVLEKLEEYPQALVMNLAVNPEMISFVCDYPGGVEAEPEIRTVELEQKCPLFLQWDKRWGYHSYGTDSTIAVSGCGPTALAMVATALTGEPVTPVDVAEYAMEKEYYLPGVGTMWTLMTSGAKHYDLDSEQMEPDDYVMKKMLDRGEMLICSMRKGDFTINGHFIVIYGYDDEGFLVNDPMCIYRSKQHWTFKQLRKQFKAIWSLCLKGEKPAEFYEKPESVTPSEPESTTPSEPESTTPSEPESTTPSEPESTQPSEPESTEPSESEPSSSSEVESVSPAESGVVPSTEPEAISLAV